MITYLKSSGAERSATHRRVKDWRSLVSLGRSPTEGSTSRRISSMSMMMSFGAELGNLCGIQGSN